MLTLVIPYSKMLRVITYQPVEHSFHVLVSFTDSMPNIVGAHLTLVE